MKKIFLLAPFGNHINPDTGLIHDNNKEFIEKIISHLEKKGHIIENAHRRERWGLEWMKPEVCTPLDYKLIQDSDLIIAIPGHPASGGVHVELGWASSLKKKIMILLEDGKEYSNLVTGLNTITDVKFIKLKDNHEHLNDLDKLL